MKITFGRPYGKFKVTAPKGTLISFTKEPTELEDGIYIIGDDGYYLLDEDIDTDTIYISVEGEDHIVANGARVCYPADGIEVRAGSSVLPFKANGKGGGGSGGSGYTLTQLYSMPSGSLSYADITLSQPWTSYDQLLFLMISRDVVSTIRCQVIFDVKSIIDSVPSVFFLLPDEANVGSFVLYMPDAQDNTLLKYTDQHNNFVYVHSIYGIKYYGSGGGGDSGNTHYKGTTTTVLENGSTTNPITINGESYTAVFGDVVVYSFTEFVFDGTQWSEFGRPFDTEPISGSTNAVTSDGVYRNTAGKKYYVNGVLKGEIFNDYVNNVASGNYSHTEGTNTKAEGDYSHAEGANTKAQAAGAHAEGIATTASASGAHAEGNHSVARGNNSHASGLYITASSDNSTAIGKYNTVDTNKAHLLIVGNGTGPQNRSNIFEVSETDANVNGELQINNVALPTPYTTMPTITESMVGKFALYLGTTTADYTKGKLYEAVSDGSSYTWEAIN